MNKIERRKELKKAEKVQIFKYKTKEIKSAIKHEFKDYFNNW